jgi:regulatory protein
MMNRSQASPKKSVLGAALDFLSRRQLSARQLAGKLESKGYSAEENAEALRKLEEWKYIDDRQYALSYIKSKEKRFSRTRIWFELQKAGLDNRMISLIMDEYYPEQQEVQNCLLLGRKMFEQEYRKYQKKPLNDQNRNIPPKELYLRKKVGDKLLAKGYQLDIVKKVLEEIIIFDNL